MTGPGHNSGDGDAALRDLIDRLLAARAEEDLAKEFTKEIYAEAKAAGYDKTALGRVVSRLRATAKDSDKVEEADALFDLYLSVYRGAQPSHAHTRARGDTNTRPPVASPAGQDEGRTDHGRNGSLEASVGGSGESFHADEREQFVASTGAGEGRQRPVDPASVSDPLSQRGEG